MSSSPYMCCLHDPYKKYTLTYKSCSLPMVNWSTVLQSELYFHATTGTNFLLGWKAVVMIGEPLRLLVIVPTQYGQYKAAFFFFCK